MLANLASACGDPQRSSSCNDIKWLSKNMSINHLDPSLFKVLKFVSSTLDFSTETNWEPVEFL